MLKLRNWALLLPLLFSTQLSSAAETGNDLLRGCTAMVRGADGAELSGEDAALSLFWTGYISGFTDSYSITQMGQKPTMYCYPPQGIENGQVARIVVKFLKENPKELHQSARLCLLLALKSAFPCNQ